MVLVLGFYSLLAELSFSRTINTFSINVFFRSHTVHTSPVLTITGGQESAVLREAKLPVWKNSDCNDAYFQPITEIFLCAGYVKGGSDACQVSYLLC